MKSAHQKVLLAAVLLQAVAATALTAALHIELWPLELLVSFTPPLITLLLLSLLVGTGVSVFLKNYKKSWPLLGALTVAWVASLYVVGYSLSVQRPLEITPSDGNAITFAALNKLYTNKQHARFIEYFKQQNVDILALQEMRPDEVTHVASQLGFEYSISSRAFATSGGTVVALVSRYPFTSASTIELATGHPIVRAAVQLPDGSDIAAYSVHIPVPASNFLYNKRNIVMDSLAETLTKDTLPVIVGGDFNTTVFSPAMREFDAATSHTLQPVATERWPTCSWYGFGSPLCLRIDHIYASKKARITSLTVAPNLGSDHRALVTTMIFNP